MNKQRANYRNHMNLLSLSVTFSFLLVLRFSYKLCLPNKHLRAAALWVRGGVIRTPFSFNFWRGSKPVSGLQTQSRLICIYPRVLILLSTSGGLELSSKKTSFCQWQTLKRRWEERERKWGQEGDGFWLPNLRETRRFLFTLFSERTVWIST